MTKLSLNIFCYASISTTLYDWKVFSNNMISNIQLQMFKQRYPASFDKEMRKEGNAFPTLLPQPLR
jgi:hypothetical protein